jgi:tetratricopeptide (TPR) repeat protein
MQKNSGKIFLWVLCILVTSALPAQRIADFITIGRMELSEDHYAKAIESLNIGLKLNPTSYDGYCMRAFAKRQLDDYSGSEEDWTKAMEIYPNRSDVYAERAYTRTQLFNYSGALADYKKALELDSNNSEIYVSRAITYLSLQQFDLAVDDCYQAEKMHSKDENLYIIRGAAETQLKRFKEAISDFNKAIARKPQIVRTYVDRGLARIGAGDKDSAMMDFNLALHIDSVNTYAMFQKGLLETDREKYTEALADMDKVLILAPYSSSAFFNRAILKAKMKDYYGALNDYAAVLNLSPDHILTYYNRANLQFEHGNLPDALQDYDKVIELYPEFIDAYRNRAEVKKNMNNPKAAAMDIKKADQLQDLQKTASDSAKYFEALKVMKMVTLSDDFETSKEAKNKIQYAHVDIQPQPLYAVILFPSPGNKIRTYDAAKRRHYGGADLTLFNKNDSMDVRLIKKKFDQLDTSIIQQPAKASNYADRALIFTALQTYDHALSDFDKAIDLDPFNALSYFSRANTRITLRLRQNSTACHPQWYPAPVTSQPLPTTPAHWPWTLPSHMRGITAPLLKCLLTITTAQ